MPSFASPLGISAYKCLTCGIPVPEIKDEEATKIVRDHLLPILYPIWKRVPVVSAPAEARPPDPGKSNLGEKPKFSPPAAPANTTKEPPTMLSEWTRMAEDLLALMLLRWLGLALWQIWTMVGFLVI